MKKQAAGDRLQAAARASRSARLAVVLVAAAVAVALAAADVDVRVQFDETFDFQPMRTWAWHPDGAGTVLTATSKYDNAEAIQKRLEPTILEAIEQGLVKTGLTQAAAGEADFHVSYYVLLSAGSSSQQMGQFLSPAWGLPPIRGATQSLKALEQGSLAVDLSYVPKRWTVWRGVAATEVDRQRPEDERLKMIRDAIAKMLAQYPPHPKQK